VIGDEDVNRSERCLDVVDQPFGSARICHVGAERPRCPAAGDDLGRERLGWRGIAAIGDGDPCDIAGEPPADRAADAATRSRDERDAPGQVESVRHRSEFTAGRGTALKIRLFPAAHRPAEEESQQPAGEQADRKDHGEEGHHSPAPGLEKSCRHEVVGSDQQQLMGQHADSMAGRTVTCSGRVTGPRSSSPEIWTAGDSCYSLSSVLAKSWEYQMT
jgi:hypothetical protein